MRFVRFAVSFANSPRVTLRTPDTVGSNTPDTPMTIFWIQQEVADRLGAGGVDGDEGDDHALGRADGDLFDRADRKSVV